MPASSATPKKNGRWTAQEHSLYLQGLELYGKDLRKVSEVVQTRTLAQVRSHHQHHVKKMGSTFKAAAKLAILSSAPELAQKKRKSLSEPSNDDVEPKKSKTTESSSVEPSLAQSDSSLTEKSPQHDDSVVSKVTASVIPSPPKIVQEENVASAAAEMMEQKIPEEESLDLKPPPMEKAPEEESLELKPPTMEKAPEAETIELKPPTMEKAPEAETLELKPPAMEKAPEDLKPQSPPVQIASSSKESSIPDKGKVVSSPAAAMNSIVESNVSHLDPIIKHNDGLESREIIQSILAGMLGFLVVLVFKKMLM